MDKQYDAEDINYWKTGKSSPDSWIDKAEKEIEGVSGEIIGRAFASDSVAGMEVYMLAFRIDDDTFKIMWPVLHSRTGNQTAARRQAATMLYHDVKAKCMSAKVLGVRKAFVPYLVLGDGRTVSEISKPELEESIEMYLPILSERV